jgi:hypothetical protein
MSVVTLQNDPFTYTDCQKRNVPLMTLLDYLFSSVGYVLSRFSCG